MVNSAEPGFKSAKNDLFVLTRCEFLKCNFEGVKNSGFLSTCRAKLKKNREKKKKKYKNFVLEARNPVKTSNGEVFFCQKRPFRCTLYFYSAKLKKIKIKTK